MNKFLSLICGLLMLSACSTVDSPIEYGESSSQQYASIEALQAYNDEIVQTPDNRGIGHWCAVGTADVLGAYRLARIGVSIGSIFGPNGAAAGLIVGGVIGGVGGSYGANSVLSAAPRHNSKDVYLNSLNAYVTLTQQSSKPTDWGLRCPDEIKDDVLAFGQYHNVILEQIMNKFENNPDEEQIMKNFQGRAFDFLRDDEYIQAYYDFYKQSAEIFHTQEVSFDDESGQIMKLFVEAIVKAPNEVQSVQMIVNDYIDIIERKSSLSLEERKILYCSFSTAEASSNYWLTTNI